MFKGILKTQHIKIYNVVYNIFFCYILVMMSLKLNQITLNAYSLKKKEEDTAHLFVSYVTVLHSSWF